MNVVSHVQLKKVPSRRSTMELSLPSFHPSQVGNRDAAPPPTDEKIVNGNHRIAPLFPGLTLLISKIMFPPRPLPNTLYDPSLPAYSVEHPRNPLASAPPPLPEGSMRSPALPSQTSSLPLPPLTVRSIERYRALHNMQPIAPQNNASLTQLTQQGTSLEQRVKEQFGLTHTEFEFFASERLKDMNTCGERVACALDQPESAAVFKDAAPKMQLNDIKNTIRNVSEKALGFLKQDTSSEPHFVSALATAELKERENARARLQACKDMRTTHQDLDKVKLKELIKNAPLPLLAYIISEADFISHPADIRQIAIDEIKERRAQGTLNMPA